MWTDPLNSKYLFFTGKGGVGKTSLACAAAIHLAGDLTPVLLVSTDPASNLDEVLGTTLGSAPVRVEDVPGLFACNLDPGAAALAYRERAVSPYRGLLPEAAIRSMEEQFSGSCTLEIAAFDEFTSLLGAAETADRYAHVVFDTAPTGHTLRLLALPGAWTSFIDNNTTGMSCLGPLVALSKQEAMYRSSLEALRDPQRTTLVLVARADAASLQEAARASEELRRLGVCNQHLIVNGLVERTSTTDPIAAALVDRSSNALANLPADLSELPLSTVPLKEHPLVGLAALQCLTTRDTAPSSTVTGCTLPDVPTSLDTLVDKLLLLGRGVVMTMGKGGVGKTTIAEEIAVSLARTGVPVLLTTTDPAGRATSALKPPVNNLKIERIDPVLEVQKYRDEVLEAAAANLDQHGLALLEEDLRSPCTEEIAVFRAFAAAIARGEESYVVIDTAPTGHTILLMDAAEAYHREVLRTESEMPASVRQLLPRLRDPEFTCVILVTLPEPTPFHEAKVLQDELGRAGITACAWVVNQSFLASGTREPFLQTKALMEARWIDEVMQVSPFTVVLPWR